MSLEFHVHWEIQARCLVGKYVVSPLLFHVSPLASRLVWEENTIRDPVEYEISTSFFLSLVFCLGFFLIEILFFSLKALFFPVRLSSRVVIISCTFPTRRCDVLTHFPFCVEDFCPSMNLFFNFGLSLFRTS